MAGGGAEQSEQHHERTSGPTLALFLITSTAFAFDHSHIISTVYRRSAKWNTDVGTKTSLRWAYYA